MPIYKCPKCGRSVEKPEGTYYCSKCGPDVLMVKQEDVVEKALEIAEDVIWEQGDSISDSMCLPRKEVVKRIAKELKVSMAEAEEILKKILKRELESGKYEYMFEFYDLICFGYRI
jgi:DNA-directed RNA polymerase subunit RPC12/RpoP